MNESVYRRLCLTSVCGAILIPVTMALVSAAAGDGGDGPASDIALVASARTATPAGPPPTRRGMSGMSDTPATDRITQDAGDAP